MIDEQGGSEEGQADFKSDLEKAWDEVTAPEEQVEEPEEKTSEERERDEKGRFKAKEASEEEEPEVEEPEEEETEEEKPEPVSAPEHWSQADKDTFNSLPEEARPFFLEKVKSLESGYNKKFEEVANERKTLEQFKPYAELFNDAERQQLQMAGMTPVAYIGRLKAIGQQLQANPAETIRWLAQQHNVDLGNPEGAEGEYADPEIVKLRAMIAEQNQQLQSFMQSQQASVAQSYDIEWQGFQNAKDANGSPQFPGAESLKVRMGQELQVNPQASGESIRDALQRAYEAVKWTDPEIRKSIIEAEAKAKEAEQRRKADLDKARKAKGPDVKAKSSPSTDQRIQPKSNKEALEQAWNELAG